MNQAIKILEDMKNSLRIEQGLDEKNYKWGILERKQTELDIRLLDTAIYRISSLPSDTQWIDRLEKELEEEEDKDIDIDSLDDYYMGLSVGKAIMLNRVKREIFPINN